MSETYPKDDFDDIPEGGPTGVHRKATNPWAPVIPFLVVLLVVPLVAWGVATLIQRNVPEEELVEILSQSETEVVQSGAQSEVVEETVEETVVVPDSDLPVAAPDDPSAQTSAAEEQVGQTTGETPAEVNYAAPIEVLNGTDISGHAAATADQLISAGFTSTSAANATDWSTDQTTVYYANSSLKATADAVAATLGINHVVEDGAAVGNADVVVLLLQ